VNAIAAADSDVGPGLLAFLVIAAIGFALFLLIKSMNKQFIKIQNSNREDGRDE
jgi:hypothetical protein